MARFRVRDREQGKAVQVNLWALLDDRLELPKEKRMAVPDEVRAQW
jgi:hypothetical protein